MLRRAALVVCIVLPTVALAAPATPEEAARLTALFETYVGHPAPGSPASVIVTPEGETYKASFDLARMAMPLHGFGIDVVAASPYVLTLTPLLDETWRVQRDALPELGITTTKGFTYSVRYLGAGSVGIFDPRIETFAHENSRLAGDKSSVTYEGHSQRSELIEDGRRAVDSHGPGPGEVSSKWRQEDHAMRYQSHTDPSAKGTTSATMGDVTARIGSAVTEATASRQRIAALLDLWAFLVAHPARDRLVAEQSKLKSLALAMIPYAGAFAGHVDLKDLKASFPQGSVAIGSSADSIVYDSASTTEGLALSVKANDLAVSLSSLPDWAVAALPHKIDLRLATSPLDFAKAARVLVDGADVAKDTLVSPDIVATALASLAPNGGPTIAIKPSTLVNDTMTISVFGAFSSAGVGKATIEANGLDAEITNIVQAAFGDPLAMRAVQMLTVARTLGAPRANGRLRWEIASDGDGLIVNGLPLR